MSLLTDHLVFSPKYRGKMLVGDVAMICEGIICKTCVEIISGRLAVSMDL